MIKIENLNKYFNRHHRNEIHVINNTSLTLGDDGLVALLGPSGSGKTTLLNAIGGLDKVKSGKIYINGKKMTSRFSYFRDKLRNLNIGYIFQDYKLVENLSVYDNVALTLKMLGIKEKGEIDKRVSYVLEKVGMWRFRKRPASMLSGGERQRVGIARALVKNPNIIIADEPTGNLDSKNTIEIMNIIKAISKERLVILVTHEVNLAKFYATRIIKIADGKVVDDYINEHDEKLDIMMDNCFYLKDFAKCEKLKKDELEVNVYSEENVKLKLNIVVKNNNIYIESENGEKIEAVDSEGNIEFINEHYKKIDKAFVENYQFALENNNKKLKYSSIFNPFTFITNGFKQVFNYSFMKKILLGGFFLSGMFIMLGVSRIAANLEVDDSEFVRTNKNYLMIKTNKINYEDYVKYKNEDDVNYLLPGDSSVRLLYLKDDIYQNQKQSLFLEGSLAEVDMLKEEDIVEGRMPKTDKEIVIDKMVEDNLLKQETAKMMGIKRKDILEANTKVNMVDKYTIVGVVDKKSPSIYTKKDEFLNILYNMRNTYGNVSVFNELNYADSFMDYTLYNNYITLKEGNFPVNDYEVLVHINHKDSWPLNKEIESEINNHKLKVVGYYDSKYDFDTFLVNKNTILERLVVESKNIAIYPKNKEKALEVFRENYNVNIIDSYENDKKDFLEERKEATKIAIISSCIIIGISLIEIFLMLRASFLSRVKEVGIFRAIGVKKKDIYIMFSGEIVAITLLSNVPGIILAYYILNNLSKITVLQGQFLVNISLFLISVLSIFLFNLIVGLIPVFNTIRKMPAEILARSDV